MPNRSPLLQNEASHPELPVGKATRTHDNLVSTGFCLAYFGVMGALVLWAVPLFERVMRPGIEFVALPAAVIGVIMIVTAHRMT